MNANLFDLLAATVIPVLILGAWTLRIRSRRRGERWLPRELRNAELVYAEDLFWTGGDISIVAKCDRGYRTKKGVIVLVELKTRKLNRVYQSDIIELSAQRYAIQMQTSENVADHAYVLIQGVSTKKCHLHRVKLMELGEVTVLAYRRRAILTGAIAGNYAEGRKLCSRCWFETKCKALANNLK